MGIFKIFGKKDPEPKPTKKGPFVTREEALAAAKAEIDRLIAEKEGESK